ncbi:acyl-CoA dehydrogenase [Burkholderia sp. BCC1977]|uniref:acyl-CoA dehydrogenase n=1 Tax=Burkholderia sp. BCC1977 TaxID=2817440 RepID=UPI002ABDDF8C|nr:acyl-CoA dehydrogenase [Burkholderia sp. BCC1977]
MLNERDIAFFLYELLDTESLLKRECYQDHSREVFDATINSAREIAKRYLLNHYQKGDANEPTLDGDGVRLIPETKIAWDVMRDAGFLRARASAEEGGMQLPEVVVRAMMGHFLAANAGSCGYYFLTLGVIELIRSFGTEDQKHQYLDRLMDGDFTGTMALTEPGQGSALADIRTRAEAQPDGTYRIFGQKMFISAGEHDLTENIVHMVLAKTRNSGPGVKGISLFLVPKYLLNDDGTLGARNDVALAGLLHKMGARNASSTVLSFGENGGAVGYLVGREGQGLACMFQMMNEARIGVGLGAAAMASMGLQHSLSYARQRPQGRLPSNRDPATRQVLLVEHADVRRMLLAQKAYAEGALALCFYASSLFEDERTHPDPEERHHAGQLLSLLTPIVKSWPSKYGCHSNDMAIQVLGGSGYIREFPVEQFYRDQRLNPIHEGTEGIHGLDLLGRKVSGKGGAAALAMLREKVEAVVLEAENDSSLADLAKAVSVAFSDLATTTETLLPMLARDPDRGLANATLYLDCFGRVVVAWLWLWQALAAARRLATSQHEDNRNYYMGKLQAARYYIEWDLPQIAPTTKLLREINMVPFDMRNEWF